MVGVTSRQISILGKDVSLFPHDRRHTHSPFVLWHLTETWPLLKTAEWDAAADRKTGEGRRRDNQLWDNLYKIELCYT